MTTYLAMAGMAVLAIQVAVAARLLRALRRLGDLEQRVGHFSDALSLLTETSEAGFRTMAAEIERLQRAPGRADARTTTARVSRAARSGQSVEEIAAAEAVSESEVALRLHLAERMAEASRPAVAPAPPPPARPVRRRKTNGSMRA